MKICKLSASWSTTPGSHRSTANRPSCGPTLRVDSERQWGKETPPRRPKRLIVCRKTRRFRWFAITTPASSTIRRARASNAAADAVPPICSSAKPPKWKRSSCRCVSVIILIPSSISYPINVDKIRVHRSSYRFSVLSVYQVVKTQYTGGSRMTYAGKEMVSVDRHLACKCQCKVKATVIICIS